MPQSLNDEEQLAADMKKVEAKLDEIWQLIAKHATPYTPEQRKALPKPPAAFLTAGPSLARAVIAHPQLSAGTGHDPKEVLTSLAKVEIIAPSAQKAARIVNALDDSRLGWLAGAYGHSLRFYALAKVVAQDDAQLQEVVDTLHDVFPGHKPPKKP